MSKKDSILNFLNDEEKRLIILEKRLSLDKKNKAPASLIKKQEARIKIIEERINHRKNLLKKEK